MEWTHAICQPCWNRRNPDRKAVRLLEPIKEWCCFCGEPTYSGIYIRHAPSLFHCQGHEDE